jgi:hypothetical protein
MHIRHFIAASAVILATPAWADVTEEKTFSYPLAADGRVSIDNINGDITIWASAICSFLLVLTVKSSTPASGSLAGGLWGPSR